MKTFSYISDLEDKIIEIMIKNNRINDQPDLSIVQEKRLKKGKYKKDWE